MNNSVLKKNENNFNLHVGDFINLTYLNIEKDKKTYKYKGLIIALKKSNKTFILYQIVDGIKVEQIFPLNSPYIINIIIKQKGNINRSKLYFIRTLSTKKLKRKKLSIK